MASEQAASLPLNQPMAPVSIQPSVCDICKETMNEGQDCLIISVCSHPFHRVCIESHLSTSSECPVCKHACELSELRTLVIALKPPPPPKVTTRGKGRGAMIRQYNTRSASRNLFRDNPTSLNNSAEQQLTPNRNSGVSDNYVISPFANNPNSNPNNGTSVGIDYTEINRMIEASISRMYQTLNFSQASPANPLHNIDLQPPNIDPNSVNNFRNDMTSCNPNIASNIPNDVPNNNFVRNLNQNPNFNPNINNPSNLQLPGNSQASNFSSNTFSFNANNMHADKVTSIINNWNLKFDGSPNGLNIDEFLYRVRTLTKETFNNDFSVICKNLNTLLTGKAREWYWRYHKLVSTVVWDEFCLAIRSQYKDMKSSFDLREELRNRKQKQGESYDSFFDALSIIADRLARPMVEEEFIEIIARNLRPEIRQDLLYVPIRSLSHLRKLVQMRENFLSDEYVRKNLLQRNQNTNFVPRRLVAEIDHQQTMIDSETEYKVDAFQKIDIKNKCWNCDNIGHYWQDCLETRTIFCYGCGIKNVYKPQCEKCATRNLTNSKNLRSTGPSQDPV